MACTILTAMSLPRIVALSAVASLVLLPLAGCADDSQQAVPAGQAQQGVSCQYPVGDNPAKPVDPPNGANVPKTGTVVATLKLDGQDVTITMDRAKAPCAVNSFESLAKQGWYDDTKCHRLVDQSIFILQCGDPSGTGRGGPGYSYADELSGKETYTKGVVAMANAGRDTNGSQIFLVWEDSPLKPDYTVLGTMDAKSTDAVAAVAAEGVAADGVSPNAPAKIESVTLG